MQGGDHEIHHRAPWQLSGALKPSLLIARDVHFKPLVSRFRGRFPRRAVYLELNLKHHYRVRLMAGRFMKATWGSERGLQQHAT